MNVQYYSFNQIQSIEIVPYNIPYDVLDIIALLNKTVVIPQNPTGETLQIIKKRGYDDKFRSAKFIKSEKNVSTTFEDSWTNEKAIFNAKNAFKVTKVETKIGVEKDINEIRISLNKISNKNYDSQKDIILQHMIVINDNESLQKIAQFIFDIASSNKFYSELYADLYKELISKSLIFKNILDIFVSTYKSTIDNIKYVDSNIDYDGYCSYVKENDKRRAMGSFFMMLSARNVLEDTLILSIIEHFQNTIIQHLGIEGKSLECEEISEIIFILVSIGNSNPLLTSNSKWNDIIIPNVLILGKLKVKEHLSLTSRIIFKQLDLKDFLSKNSKHN